MLSINTYGYLYLGKPLANVTFKIYGTISMGQAFNFLSDFKLGYYMKFPPKSMFIAQLAGTIVGSTVHFGTTWWLLASIDKICNTALLPKGSQMDMTWSRYFLHVSIIWGVVGPQRMFTKDGIYPQMNWFFLIGFLAPVPVRLLSRKYPEKKWIKLIHMPMILGGPLGMPYAKAVHYMSWEAVGIFFNYYVYRRFKQWHINISTEQCRFCQAKEKMESYGEDEVPKSKSLQKHQTSIDLNEDEEVDDNPIEEVRLTVPITDDPSLPALTFRTWVLGIISCCLLAFMNQFFGYRQNNLFVGSVSAQILVLPIGQLMAATLTSKQIRVPLTKWSFSLNPGPFNIKEHVLITIFASSGASGVAGVAIITIVKAFYHRQMNPVAAMLLVQTTQLMGYGWAGLFRKYLVDSPYMWWPGNLVQVSLFRALNEKEKRARGGLTRLQFFLIVFISSFAYYIVPGYLFPSISALSFVCWIWKDSITAQKLGSGLQGLGIGSFGLDWSTVAGFLGSPLATPFFVIANILVGFFLFLYVLIPIAYWSNTYEAGRFPLFSPHTFDSKGQPYNITRILNNKAFEFDKVGYDNYSKLYLSVMFAFIYGMNFAFLMASITHVALFDGK
ncbi:hypothetical protein QYF36_020620 [Acer negundo]|nr:hypothetical protein QYF36_020620 [Acer negundo]